jgi:tetratricopeptide (TPR) repeat protein
VSPRPLVFISAVSRELKSARQLVANTLSFLGYEPVWQEIFGTEGGDLRQVLREQIDQCKGVVQLIGRCYGAEPPKPDEQFGRVSYTQYEALYARERGKKVWYLFIDEHFPADSAQAEPAELEELQAAYRKRVQSDTHLFHPLTSPEALEMSVLKLRDDLLRLRRGVKRWAAAVAILLVVSVALGFFVLHSQHQTEREVSETRQAMTAMTDELSKLRQGIAAYPQVEAQIQQSQPSDDVATTQEKVYAELGKQIGIDPKTLQQKLPQAAAQLQGSIKAATYDRANAAFVAKDFPGAERLALQAAGEAQKSSPPRTEDAVRALQLAAWSAQNQLHLDNALKHFREAEKLTDRQKKPAEWARVQQGIGQILFQQGNFAGAVNIYRGAIEARTAKLGPENAETLHSRASLAEALNFDGKRAEAEAEDRAVIEIQQKSLGPTNPDTLATRKNLAAVLNKEGQFAKAESEARDVVELQTKTLGHNNPDTVETRGILAMALVNQGKLDDAEKEYREILALREKRLGPERPKTLNTRHSLAVILRQKGDYAGAEKEFREISEIAGRILGPEHPTTLLYRHNLAMTLREEGKYADAEAEFRGVVALRAKVLGPEHPETLESEFGLARTLNREQKHDEAQQIAIKVAAAAPKAWGESHPMTKAVRRLSNGLQRNDDTDPDQ